MREIEAIELGISLLIRLSEKLFLWFEHKKILRQQQSLDRFKNTRKPRKGVSPCTAYVSSPNMRLLRREI